MSLTRLLKEVCRRLQIFARQSTDRSETQNPRLLSQQCYDDEQFLNDHHMHSFIEGSIPDKFQNDQMIRDGAESLAKRFFLLSCTFVCDKLESKMD